MTVITITTQHDSENCTIEMHRPLAAIRLGKAAAPDEIMHTSGPDLSGVEVIEPAQFSEPVYSEDGAVLVQPQIIRPARSRYHFTSTWMLRPKPVPTPAPAPEAIPWPTLALSRGARYHGPVTIDGETAEREFISDGERLVLLDSIEGRAVLAELEAER